MRGILLHPVYFLLAAALLFAYGAVFGHLTALLGVPCFLYFAWHFRRRDTRERVLRAGRRQPPARIRRLTYISFLVGLALGAIQAYWQFVQLGWDRLSALAVSAGVIAFSALVIWLVLRAVWGPKEIAGA